MKPRHLKKVAFFIPKLNQSNYFYDLDEISNPLDDFALLANNSLSAYLTQTLPLQYFNKSQSNKLYSTFPLTPVKIFSTKSSKGYIETQPAYRFVDYTINHKDGRGFRIDFLFPKINDSDELVDNPLLLNFLNKEYYSDVFSFGVSFSTHHNNGFLHEQKNSIITSPQVGIPFYTDEENLVKFLFFNIHPKKKDSIEKQEEREKRMDSFWSEEASIPDEGVEMICGIINYLNKYMSNGFKQSLFKIHNPTKSNLEDIII